MAKFFNRFSSPRPAIEKVEDNTILPRLEAIIANPNASEREKAFALSLKSGFERYGSLTIGQFSAMQKMEAAHSPDVAIANAEWRNSFDSRKRTILTLCVEYYSKTTYFANTVRKVIADPTYIPTEKEYRAMCENKYAQRLISNIESEQKFNPTDIVEIRKTARHLLWETNTRIGTVLTCEEHLDTKRGSRVYHVLLFGDDGIVKVPERDLKKYRDKKVKDVVSNT